MDTTQTTPPAPAPMVRETITKDDGRALYFYTFPDGKSSPAQDEKATEEDSHV